MHFWIDIDKQSALVIELHRAQWCLMTLTVVNNQGMACCLMTPKHYQNQCDLSSWHKDDMISLGSYPISLSAEILFSAATKQLDEWSVGLSITPFWQCSCHPIIMKLSGVITIDRSDAMQKVKVRGQRSRSQRSKQILSQFGRFWTVTPVWIHRWLRNYAHSLKWQRRGALLFFVVICQIWKSHGPENQRFGFDLNVSRWQLQLFEFMDGNEMTHIASRSIEEVSYSISRSSVKFQGHTGWKIDFDWIWARLPGWSNLSNPSNLPCL